MAYDMSKAYSARRIAIGALSCPACRLRIEDMVQRCPHCGFSGADTLRMFPYGAPKLEPVLDVPGSFAPSDRRRIERRIKRLRRRLRQIHWCVCVVNLPREGSLRLCGFWLLNAAPVEPGDGEAANAWTVLLLLDPGQQAVSVSCGYALEPFVSDDSWLRSLELMSEAWQRGARGEAVVDFLDGAEAELAQAARRVDRMLRKGGRR